MVKIQCLNMAICGRCIIEISVTTRDELIARGAKPRAKSYDVVLGEIFEENNDLRKTNDKLSRQNDELQSIVVKIATNGDGN